MLVRSAALVAFVLLVVQGQAASTRRVAVWYAGPMVNAPATALGDMEPVTRDLRAMRRAGYNAIVTWIGWSQIEPRRGALALAESERLAAAAAAEDLQVVVKVLIGTPPAWAKGDPAAADRFVETVRARLGAARAVANVEPVRAPAPPDLIEVGTGGVTPARARLEFWSATARGATTITFSDRRGGFGAELRALGETAGVVTRNLALFAPLGSRGAGVRQVSGGSGPAIDVHLLESPDAFVIIALNRSPTSRRVRIAFAPDIPEAIWQNMETGTSVNFVMERDGPFLEHTFAGHDALVLTTGKRLRGTGRVAGAASGRAAATPNGRQEIMR